MQEQLAANSIISTSPSQQKHSQLSGALQKDLICSLAATHKSLKLFRSQNLSILWKSAQRLQKNWLLELHIDIADHAFGKSNPSFPQVHEKIALKSHVAGILLMWFYLLRMISIIFSFTWAWTHDHLMSEASESVSYWRKLWFEKAFDCICICPLRSVGALRKSFYQCDLFEIFSLLEQRISYWNFPSAEFVRRLIRIRCVGFSSRRSPVCIRRWQPRRIWGPPGPRHRAGPLISRCRRNNVDIWSICI